MTPVVWLEARFACQLMSYWAGEWAPGTYVRPMVEILSLPHHYDPNWDQDADDIDVYYLRLGWPGDCQGDVYHWKRGDPIYTGLSTRDKEEAAA